MVVQVQIHPIKNSSIFANFTKDIFNLKIFNELKSLLHFDTDLSIPETLKAILNFRKEIENADGIIICTSEYVFSMPSGLKNAIEWCVSMTLFTEKPLGIITLRHELMVEKDIANYR